MKKLFFLPIFIIGMAANATNYYISANGNDANNGTSPTSSWKTLNKLNSFFSSLKPGDNVYLNKGDTFYGSITVASSGSAGSPITIGAYGSGANPIITGFTTVNSWTILGGNIWESTSPVSTLSTCNMVVINGVNTPMGRYPNSGFLTYKSHNGTTQFTDNTGLTGSPNWKGAEFAFFITTYVVNRSLITAQSGSTLTIIPADGNGVQYDNQRYIIQNDPRTLDVTNEWYYNPSTKKIRVYNNVSPTNVKISTVDTAVYLERINYITFDHLDFTGQNSTSMEISNSKYISVTNCNFYQIGEDAIDGRYQGNSTGCIVTNNTFNDINNNAIHLQGNHDHAYMAYNNISNIGLIMGAGRSSDGQSVGLFMAGTGSHAEYNTISNTGYVGLYFANDSSIVNNNFIDNGLTLKTDGGCIYTSNGNTGTSNYGRKVFNNIVINSPNARGIYIDDASSGVEAYNNTVANCEIGFYLHGNHDINIHNNTLYNNSGAQVLLNSEINEAIRNNNISSNLFVSKDSSQLCLLFQSVYDDIAQFGLADNNYYARPINDDKVIWTSVNGTYFYSQRNIASWQSYSSQDAHSKKSPRTITDINDLTFQYNASNSPLTIPLPYNYMDLTGATYNGSITLQPYTSGILIKNGPIIGNIAPVASAGNNQLITLPVNAVSLSGSGTDADGTVTNYLWTQISGPVSYNIANPSSPVTNVSGLTQGTYVFQLTVTDNNGATGTSTVQVTVNPAANIPPVANAGNNQLITLPVNAVSLSGSGTDADGSVTDYLWTQISGPSSYYIVNPSSPVTNVTGLSQGVYVFQLTVTDNNGATGKSTVQVSVNPVPNIPPVANAGDNISITLPANTISLSGSGTDADGTITNYLWTQIAGPASFNIVNPSSPLTDVSGLTQGIYVFQLTVTDNNGATATSAVQVTVNPTANIPPIANAGSDMTITLPINSVSLSGSGSDTDGTITNYLWSKISGPLAVTITNSSSASTNVSGLVQGVYVFQLKVTDNNGASGTSILQVTVNPAANIPPVANAGANNSITLPADSVLLSGNGTDADGTVVSYLWSNMSGPSSYNIANPSSPVTNVSGLTQGTYVFQLTVTDNSGATGTSTVQVTVNPAANIPPVANAGANNSITLPADSILLSGNGTDADGTVVSYLWSKISGPSSYNIANPSSPVTDVTSLAEGIYVFQLTVTDNNGATGTSTVQVTVNSAPNIPPVANAGINKSITLPADTVLLSGSGTDSDGTITNYLWTQISGPNSYNIVNDSAMVTDVTGLVHGVYVFQLMVIDNNGSSATSSVQVTVNPEANIPPVANAGLDQTIALPVNTISLSGSGTDADGTVVSYLWTKISGPSSYNIADSSLPVTNVTQLVQGIYIFQLKVTDNNGASTISTLQLTVNAAGNIPPIANAGANKSITLPTNIVSLSGNGTDADGTVTVYSWTKVSGPLGGTIETPSSVSTNVYGLDKGVYVFQLTVTDNNGAMGTSSVQVTVNPALNIHPVANAGADQTITLPINSTLFSGSGSDADGTITKYLWRKLSGPSFYHIVTPSSPVTDVSGLIQGTYVFQLKVTDNKGASATSTLRVTVNPAANIAPVASAGNNQLITLPVNAVSLSGSGTDADGTVTNYLWTQISGPVSYNIANPSSPVTNVSGLTQGTYVFQLTVTDNNGATGTSTVQVTVNPAANIPPVANAGNNQLITLPVNAVSLSGSGTDADGSVTDYLWTQISGPSSYYIVNPSSPVTNVTGLSQGVYVFQLTVTDNNGATGKSTVQVSVNPVPNIPPVANAGDNISITLPANTISLSGSGTDADGTITNYLWTQIAGPASFNIVNPSSPLTDVSGLTQGIYVFQLTVTDNNGATATSAVQVTVNPTANIPPIANAGSDMTITLPINSVSLSGSGSDTDGTITNYLWSKISGPLAVTITNSSSASTNVSGLVQGVYVFQLKVTDNNGASGTSILQVTVNPAANIPPVANAGANNSITLPADSVLLSGNGTDADGTVVSYLWSNMSGPSSYNIANPSSPVTNVSGLTQGTYVFQLTVTDNSGATGTSTVQVTVNPAANIPPVANAGANNSITLPADSILLSGNGTDADGTVVSYLWSKISGPSSYNIANPSSPVTDVTSLAEGIYVFQLTVTDNNGATGTSTVQVTVNSAPNIPPVANAGINKSITLPADTVLLSGSGTDSDGTVVSYLWSKILGPSSYNIANPSSPVTDVSGLTQGIYVFQLTVTDNNGATGTSTLQVTVNPGANIPPVANAGTNKSITLPTSIVSLSGNGTDADGTVVSYLWTKISGPSSYNIANPSSPVTNVSGLTQGTYVFHLTVTDNSGATGTSTVQVTVNPAPNIPPIANAGANKSITLPTSIVSLSGNGTDADGTVVSYLWSKISGPSSYNIVNPSSPVTDVSGLAQGVYVFQLKVTDNNGASSTSSVQVTVNAAANISPVANAGTNKSITLPTSIVSLSGNGTDADGTVVSYLWSKISGPSSYNIINPSSPVTDVSGLALGVYVFQLKVTDNNGASSTSSVQVTVNAAANISPVANAGANKSITLPTSIVSLSGNGTDADGTVVSYLWSKISGPSSYNIVNPSSPVTDVSGLAQGVYVFQLKVTDNNGASSTSSVQVTVNAAANISPVANAGANKSITLPTNTVSLSGNGTDADGTVVSYLWSKISGPSSYNIINPSSPVTDVSGLALGVYVFQLKVTDNNGASSTSSVQVTVNAAANISPVANAGANKSITLPTSIVSLSGNGTDADGTVVSYLWSKISGPSSYNIVNPSSPVTDVSGLAQGVYVFQLKVTDNNGASSTSSVQVTINAAANISPVANAGANKSITLPTSIVSLSGNGTDADGTVVSYLWSKISGPSSYNIVNPSSPVTDVSGLAQGVYVFQLKVTDNNGASSTSSVQVTVNAAANISPVANAGTNKSITLPTSIVSLSGNGTDADGTVVSYLWSKISGPSSYNIINPSSPVTDVSGLALGVYVFQLKVTDNNGASSTSSVQVTVNAAANISPVANAGANKSITLPTSIVSLSGNGTDADGTVVSYLWSKISGPSSYNIVNPSSPVTDVSGLAQGVYVFQLKVTDNNGASSTSSVQVTVNAAANISPVANAGADQTITLPVNTVSLSGSGTDTVGVITAYLWKQLSGPTTSDFSSPDSASTISSGLVSGVYQYELTVTNNLGETGKDTVMIIVAAPRLIPSVQSNQINIYPNPVIDKTTLEINTTLAGSNVLVMIADAQGKMVYKEIINAAQNKTVQQINMNNLQNGAYIVTVIFSSGEKQTKTIIKL